ECRGEVLPCVGNLTPPSRTNLVAHTQRRAPGSERHAIHVERLVHRADVFTDLFVGDRAAETKPREAAELREAAQHDQRLPVDDVSLAPEPALPPAEGRIGLLSHA